MRHKAGLCLLLAAQTAVTCLAQAPPSPRALVLDGDGPWRDDRWNLTVTEFSSLLTDAGYQVSTVSPVDLASALGPPEILLAAPSLESLPLDAFKAIAAHIARGGGIMASGGEPFRQPLYQAPDGGWSAAILGSNLLQNGSFETPFMGDWRFGVDQTGAVATIDRTSSTATDGAFSVHINVTSPAPLRGAVQFYQGGLPLTKGSTYAVRFSAKASSARTMHVNVLKDGGDFHSYGLSSNVVLGTDWSDYTLTFQATETVQDGRVNFYFGDQAGETWLDNVILAAVVSEPFTPPVIETLSPSYKQYVTQYAGQTVRVPIARGRGISATSDPNGRYRFVGDLQVPAATWYITKKGTLTVWLPWPQLVDPNRAQLVALMSAAPRRLYLLNAGAAQIITLPSESVTLGGSVLNAAQAPANAILHWTISAAGSAPAFQSDTPLSLSAAQAFAVPAVNAGKLPAGNYTVTASLRLGSQEIDRIDSVVRVLDPLSTRRPDQRISVVNGTFYAEGQPVFLQGVNYAPRNWIGLEVIGAQTWLAPQFYDPDIIEADLSLLSSLHFNLVSVPSSPILDASGARSLIDFLERCRNHGLWANIAVAAFFSFDFNPAVKPLNPATGGLLQAAMLPGNDRVFAYDLAWEPNLTLFLNFPAFAADSGWRAWIAEQYGSVDNAENSWGWIGPRGSNGQLTNPPAEQFINDGPWRVMIAAYRRFAEDSLSRLIGKAVRDVRRFDADTLLSFRNWIGGQNTLSFDSGTAAANLDFLSMEGYGIPAVWPAGRGWGFVPWYLRFRSGGKPVYWAEYSFMAPGGVGANGGTPAGRATQAAYCDTVMRLVSETGSSAASAWWFPGGWLGNPGADYGIFDPDGSPRDCALVLAQWGTMFAATPPDQGSGPATLSIDREVDARGQYGMFLRYQDAYIEAIQAGRPVVLTDPAGGTDTSTMPFIQVGNAPYTGAGPLKYANAELGGIRVTCPGVDVMVENGAQVQANAGSTCQLTPTLVNTGSAAWVPAAQGKGGVTLHTSLGDLPLKNTLGSLQRATFGALPVTVGQNPITVTGRLTIQGAGPYGESLRVIVAGK